MVGETVEMGEADGLEVAEVNYVVEVREGVHFTPWGRYGRLERVREERQLGLATAVMTLPETRFATHSDGAK